MLPSTLWRTPNEVHRPHQKETPHQSSERTQKSCEGDLTNIQPNQTNDNEIPFHHATTGHSFKFEDTKILERERNKFRRMVLEGMHIYSNKDSVVNIKSGLTIDNCWAPFVKELGFPGKDK